MAELKEKVAPQTDEHGYHIDPTKNVIALSEASNKRQDDLRAAQEKYTESQINHIREYSDSQIAQVKELLRLQADFHKQLSEAEAKRIDAIRAVDVNAVAVASERQTAQASVLANQVSQSADALRTLVATTAATMAEQQRQLFNQFQERLTAVERSQYEGRGKELVADPQLAQMLGEIKSLRESRSTVEGKSAGINWVWGVVLGAASFVSAVVAAISTMIAMSK